MKVLGVFLIAVSFLLWAALFAVPFLPVSILAKAGVVTFLLVAAEILFWAGCLLAGAEWAKRVWEKFAEKLKKKPETSDQ